MLGYAGLCIWEEEVLEESGARSREGSGGRKWRKKGLGGEIRG